MEIQPRAEGLKLPLGVARFSTMAGFDNPRAHDTPVLEDLLDMDEDQFSSAWLEIVGEPPAILLSRPVMIEILQETMGFAKRTGPAEPRFESASGPTCREPTSF